MPNKMTIYLGFAVLLSMVTPAGAQQIPDPVKEPAYGGSVGMGKLTFDQFCAQCHGISGVGTDQGPPFLSRIYHPGHHADGAFFLAARNGVRAHHWKFGNMPPVEGISDRQIQMIVDYVRALQQVNGIF